MKYQIIEDDKSLVKWYYDAAITKKNIQPFREWLPWQTNTDVSERISHIYMYFHYRTVYSD